jgi:hypothetical protein
MDGLPATGRVRTCHVAGFGPFGPGVIRERLVHFDRDGRSLSYEVAEGLPGFITHAVNRWSVRSRGDDACTVQIHATLTMRPVARPLGPVLRWRLRAGTRRVLADFQHRVETGRPHPVKVAALARGKALP